MSPDAAPIAAISVLLATVVLLTDAAQLRGDLNSLHAVSVSGWLVDRIVRDYRVISDPADKLHDVRMRAGLKAEIVKEIETNG